MKLNYSINKIFTKFLEDINEYKNQIKIGSCSDVKKIIIKNIYSNLDKKSTEIYQKINKSYWNWKRKHNSYSLSKEHSNLISIMNRWNSMQYIKLEIEGFSFVTALVKNVVDSFEENTRK